MAAQHNYRSDTSQYYTTLSESQNAYLTRYEDFEQAEIINGTTDSFAINSPSSLRAKHQTLTQGVTIGTPSKIAFSTLPLPNGYLMDMDLSCSCAIDGSATSWWPNRFPVMLVCTIACSASSQFDPKAWTYEVDVAAWFKAGFVTLVHAAAMRSSYSRRAYYVFSGLLLDAIKVPTIKVKATVRHHVNSQPNDVFDGLYLALTIEMVSNQIQIAEIKDFAAPTPHNTDIVEEEHWKPKGIFQKFLFKCGYKKL